MLDAVEDESYRLDLLCRLNVLEQATHVARNGLVQEAWGRGMDLTVHAWFYEVSKGTLCDLNLNVGHGDSIGEAYTRALTQLTN